MVSALDGLILSFFQNILLLSKIPLENVFQNFAVGSAKGDSLTSDRIEQISTSKQVATSYLITQSEHEEISKNGFELQRHRPKTG